MRKKKIAGMGVKNILNEKAEPVRQHKNLFQTGYKVYISEISKKVNTE